MKSFLAGLVGGIVGALLVLRFAPQAVETVRTVREVQQGLPISVEARSHEAAVVAAVKKAEPAVVSIVLTADVPVFERNFTNPFEDFFDGQSPFGFQFRVPQLEQRGVQRQEVGGGSGFLISADGLIVTNKHVVSREDVEYTVFTSDGEKHEVSVVTRDPALDIAVLRIAGNNLPFLELGTSENLVLGQSVIAIGNALAEFRNTVSVGVISGLSRSIVAGDELGGESEVLEHVVQTDAAINPGNSGGPLLNLDGNVIAVNVAVAFGSENIGFAIPVNEVKPVVEAAKSGKHVSRPFLGVRHIQITPALKDAENLPADYGALVLRGETAQDVAVTPGSAADKAGIVENDIILEIDGVRIDEKNSLASLIRQKQVGQTVRLKILHDGQEKEVNATLDEVPQ